MQKHFLLSALAAAGLALVIPACGGSTSGGPTIDSATVSDSPVPQNDDGSYTVDLSVDFSDDVDVDTYNFDSDAANIHITDAIDPPAPSGTLTLEIELPDGTASGTVDFDISVEDIDNLTSNDFAGTVILDQ